MTENLCPKCRDILPLDARACACGWRSAGPKAKDGINRYCCWNDHGYDCGLVGSLSESTNGTGPWYCSKHWWQLKGYSPRAGETHVSFRERYYAEQGKPYEPPNPGNLANIGHLGPRQREPGEDWDEVAA